MVPMLPAPMPMRWKGWEVAMVGCADNYEQLTHDSNFDGNLKKTASCSYNS